MKPNYTCLKCRHMEAQVTGEAEFICPRCALSLWSVKPKEEKPMGTRFIVIEAGSNSHGDQLLMVVDCQASEKWYESFPEGCHIDWLEYQDQLNGRNEA